MDLTLLSLSITVSEFEFQFLSYTYPKKKCPGQHYKLGLNRNTSGEISQLTRRATLAGPVVGWMDTSSWWQADRREAKYTGEVMSVCVSVAKKKKEETKKD